MKDLDKKVSYSYKVNISKAALRLQFSFVQEKVAECTLDSVNEKRQV